MPTSSNWYFEAISQYWHLYHNTLKDDIDAHPPCNCLYLSKCAIWVLNSHLIYPHTSIHTSLLRWPQMHQVAQLIGLSIFYQNIFNAVWIWTYPVQALCNTVITVKQHLLRSAIALPQEFNHTLCLTASMWLTTVKLHHPSHLKNSLATLQCHLSWMPDEKI